MGIPVKSVNGYVSDSRGNAASNESGVIGTAMASSRQRSMAGMQTGRVVEGIVEQNAPSQGHGSRRRMQGDVRSHEPSALAVEEGMAMARQMAFEEQIASRPLKSRMLDEAHAGASNRKAGEYCSEQETKNTAGILRSAFGCSSEETLPGADARAKSIFQAPKQADGGMTYSFSDEITGGATMGDKVARLKFKEKGKDGKVYSESFKEAEADVNSKIGKVDVAAKKNGVSQQAANKSTGPKTAL